MTADLKQAIKQQAYKMGFSLLGITSCEALPHADVFETWIGQGRHGEMTYLDTPRSRAYRAHPDRLLTECRSVLVLGMRYTAPPPTSKNTRNDLRPRGRIAAYAWGEDYHETLPRRLRSLVDFIEEHVGHPVPNRWYTDTGPILERELAQRAGLGWIGKNTCLINPAGGSYFLLAEILLGMELEPDQPFSADRCGTCSRCITACPTGCILPDRTLDARRCIAYLTIELKGSIPVELRPLMDGWVFGCDVCQQVCPWNRFANSEVDSEFAPTLISSYPDLLEEFIMPASDFNHRFRHSPIRRAKRRGYLRNIAVALGNLGSPEAVAPLAQALVENPELLVRLHAAWALGQIGGMPARQALERAVLDEADLQVKTAIQSVLVNK
jgi:epoxyqueuosine reductase